MEDGALYVRDGDAYVATIFTQGGWDPGAQNGAAVLALLGHCLEDVPTLVPMSLARFTVDLVRPVPIAVPLHVRPTIMREGKKLQVVVQELFAGGVVHVRATALRLRTDEVSDVLLPPTKDATPEPDLPPPDDIERRVHAPDAPGFLRGIDLRRVPDLCVWVRLAVPVVAGEPTRDTARITAPFDFAQLINADMQPAMSSLTMINPDVTAHLLRSPVGEWTAVTGETRFDTSIGRGLSSARLHDDNGMYGVASTTQLIQSR